MSQVGTMTAAEIEALDGFAARLRTIRIERGLSLRRVAGQIGIAGSSVLRNWEIGLRRPRTDLLQAWAACLDVDIPPGVRGWTLSESPCGTIAAYVAHHRRDEHPCTPCQDAHKAYQRHRRTLRSRP